MRNVMQSVFDFLMPYPPSRTLLRPDEVARCIGRKIQHVYDLIDEGKLNAHAPTGREKQRYMITRQSVLLYLAESALYDPDNYMVRVERLIDGLSRDQLDRILRHATRRRAQL